MTTTIIDGFTVKSVDDGRDYRDIWLRFRRGEIPCEYERVRRTTSVHIMNIDGGRLVLKTSNHVEKHWENKLSRLVHGPVFSRIMERSNRGIEEGCTCLQRVYMVAERMERGLALESAMLLEYKEGIPLNSRDDWATGYSAQITKTVKELHAHRIAHIDLNPGNFILDAEGNLSVIDLSFRDSFLMGRAKDALYLKRRYGIELETPSLLDRFMMVFVAAQRRLRAFSRKLRGGAKT